MEETCFSETSVDFQRNTRHYMPQGGTSPNHPCENLKSYKQSVGSMTTNSQIEEANPWAKFSFRFGL
jgi:hypothetical protein